MTLDEAKDLFRQGDPAGALKVCESLLGENADDPNALLLSAHALIALERKDEAYERLCRQRELYRRHAVRPRAHFDLGLAFQQIGRLDDAEKSMAQAARMRPDAPALWLRHAQILLELGNDERASVVAKHALTQARVTPELLSDLAIVLHRAGYFFEAVEAYERCAKVAPAWEFVYSNWAAALMELGRPDDALAVSERWLSVLPDSIEALAFKTVASVEVGDMEEAQKLLDFDRFVNTVLIDVPDGYADIDAFNRALEEHVLSHPDLKMPDKNHPTYHHPKLRITGEILSGEPGPVAGLEQAMHKAVAGYLDTLGDDRDHPFVANKPSDYRLSAWAAVLDGEGNQHQHIHEDGYLSGC